MNRLFSLDRKEDAFAVLQDDSGENRSVLCSLLPCDAKEGDLFYQDETGKWIFCPEETEKKREAVQKRLAALWGEE